MIVLVLNGLAGLALIVIYSSSQKAPQAVVQKEPAPAPEAPPMGKVVVAKTKLRFGNELTPDNLKVVAWPADALPEGSFASVPNLFEGASRRVALRTIEPNEPVTKLKVSGFGGKASLSNVITPGMRAVSIRVNELLGVAGFVLPGDRVDIMLTREDQEGSRAPMTHILLQDVRVLAVDQRIEGQAEGPNVVDTVTVEVTIEHVQKLILAQRVGTITLTLRNATPTSEGNPRPNTARVNDLKPAWENFKPKPRVRKRAAAPEPKKEEGPKVTVFRGLHESHESVAKDTSGGAAAYSGRARTSATGAAAASSEDTKSAVSTVRETPETTGEPVRLVPPNYNQRVQVKEDDSDSRG
ncbi:MAG: Flp pilus assembly protein CpaB [Alphaproteobacteria bacterium]